MVKIVAGVAGLLFLAAIGALQYLTWQEAKAAHRAAIYASVVARDAVHSAGEASDRAGIACRAALEAIGKLPKGNDIWTTPTIENSGKGMLCGGVDLDAL